MQKQGAAPARVLLSGGAAAEIQPHLPLDCAMQENLVLDGLVRFAGDEDAVLGVLGHELGHVAQKHSVRQVLQSVGVGAVASLLWGDFSGVAASVPIVAGMLGYSREFEREADEFEHSYGRPTRL